MATAYNTRVHQDTQETSLMQIGRCRRTQPGVGALREPFYGANAQLQVVPRGEQGASIIDAPKLPPWRIYSLALSATQKMRRAAIMYSHLLNEIK
ncbi:MAG: hypothetical protein R3C68_19320 [Myxococcota bacterium]